MHKPILNQTPRTPLQVLRDVTFGLLIRELKTRFGSYRLGYAWALIDPLLMISAFSLIFGLRNHSGFGGVPAPLFITAGYLPFLFFKNVVSKLQSAVGANMGLFCYRQVTPFATFVARFMLEVMVGMMVGIILVLGLLWFGFDAIPADPLQVILGYLLLHLKNIGETLQKLCKYYPLIGATLKPVLAETKNRYKLSFYIKDGSEWLHLGKYQSEIHLSSALSLLNKVASTKITPEYATFRHPQPVDISEYKRIFGEKLYFEEDENALIFSKEALEVETIHQNPSLLKIFETEAEKSLGLYFHGSVKDEVAGIILASMDGFEFSLQDVAAKMGLHPRSLQKRLQEDNTSFAAVLSEVRQKLALHYLSKGADATTIAVCLGYSELSAFLRAFKKWYGVSPKEYAKNTSN